MVPRLSPASHRSPRPAPGDRRRQGRAAAGLAAWLALAVGAAAGRGEDGIRDWIAQLGSDQFARREDASRRLAAAGPEALEPLAEAARGADLEVASRAIEILGTYLDPRPASADEAGPGDEAPAAPAAQPEADDAARALLALDAERVLETLAEGAPGPVPQLASTALEYHQLGMHESARVRLETLGVKFADGTIGALRRGLTVTVDSNWTGAAEDLRLLTRLRNLRHVAIHGLRIDPATLAVLGRLRTLETLQLFGTGVSDDAVATLQSRFPNAEIDVRKGGKLGVGGQRLIGPCQITQVVPGAAADRAGIRVGDIVLSMDGEPIRNFDALTDFIGGHAPGDAIDVEVERPVAGAVPQRFTCTVKLDGWD